MAEMSGRTAFSGVAELVLQNEPAGDLYYFAYGSNMSHEQMLARCAEAKVIAVAKLADHRLAFFGSSVVWDGGEETVVPASGEEVWGVVYEWSASAREKLDDWQDARMDGSGACFHFPAKVTDQQGKEYRILLYKLAKQGTPQKPSQEYQDFIVRSAVARELPSTYVDGLRGMESTKARFAVPRERKSPREAGCTGCGDDDSSMIHIDLSPS